MNNQENKNKINQAYEVSKTKKNLKSAIKSSNNVKLKIGASTSSRLAIVLHKSNFSVMEKDKGFYEEEMKLNT